MSEKNDDVRQKLIRSLELMAVIEEEVGEARKELNNLWFGKPEGSWEKFRKEVEQIVSPLEELIQLLADTKKKSFKVRLLSKKEFIQLLAEQLLAEDTKKTELNFPIKLNLLGTEIEITEDEWKELMKFREEHLKDPKCYDCYNHGSLCLHEVMWLLRRHGVIKGDEGERS